MRWSDGRTFSGYLVAETAFDSHPWNPLHASRVSVQGTVMPRLVTFRIRNGWLVSNALYASSEYDYPDIKYRFHLYDESWSRRAEDLGSDGTGYVVEGEFTLPRLEPDASVILSPLPPPETSLL